MRGFLRAPAAGCVAIGLVAGCGSEGLDTLDHEAAAEAYAAVSHVRDGDSIVLRSPNGGQVAAIAGDRRDNGAPVILAAANSATGQWRLRAADRGAFRVVNVVTGKCLDVAGDRQEHAHLQQWDCGTTATSDNQMWWFNDFAGASSNLVSVRSGLVLTVVGDQPAPGAALEQLHDQSTPAQRWLLAADGANVAAPGAAAPAAGTAVKPAPAAAVQPAPSSAASAGTPAGPSSSTALSSDHKAMLTAWMQKLMDVPHMVEGNRGLRGQAGQFAKLTAAQVDEFVAAIAYCADHFMPQHLPFEDRAAIVAAEISAESAFQPGTSAPNPGRNDPTVRSVGVLQVTPQIWVPLFQKRCDVPGLRHYDGSPWNPQDTTMESMSTSIWDNAVVAMWAVQGQALSGAANPRASAFHEQTGPCPKTPWTGQYCWVAGFPAAASGGDLANQKDGYRAMIRSDIAFVGRDPGIIDQPYDQVATN